MAFLDFSFLSPYIVGGASYKDLDFGAGIQYASAPNVGASGIGPLLTVGWNIRFYEHR